MQQLASYQQGKLILWAWVSRGLTSFEQVADWYHAGNLELAKDFMKRTKGMMAGLCHLEEAPTVDTDKGKELAAAASSATLNGESHTWWEIFDLESEDPTPIPLPSWFQLPLDHVILTWWRELETWARRTKERLAAGKGELPPKMLTTYNNWLGAPTRTLVLDKRRQQTQVISGFRLATARSGAFDLCPAIPCLMQRCLKWWTTFQRQWLAGMSPGLRQTRTRTRTGRSLMRPSWRTCRFRRGPIWRTCRQRVDNHLFMTLMTVTLATKQRLAVQP